jgi:hypothetical protein
MYDIYIRVYTYAVYMANTTLPGVYLLCVQAHSQHSDAHDFLPRLCAYEHVRMKKTTRPDDMHVRCVQAQSQRSDTHAGGTRCVQAG